MFRIHSQTTGEGTAKWAGYALCYVVLVIFTLFFSWTYLKRILYMAFLTMIAPLVAMTYPIDKITDGKAQAFDTWLKEYIFNLMIQPLHLLLYAVLVSSAFELASKSPLYALVAIGFLMPAEKLMRRFFGFEKAKTPGLLGGAAGAAIAMTGLQNLGKHKFAGGKSSGGNEKSKETNKVRFANKNSVNVMEGVAGEGAVKDIATSVDLEGSKGGNQRSYHSRLTPGQVEELKAEGIEPGDQEYDSELRSYGITPDEVSSALKPEENEESTDENVSENLNVSQNQATIGKEEEKNKRSIKRAVGAATLGIGKQLAGKALTGIHPLKLAGRLATGATLGTAGLLLGVASGDPNKAFQYTTAGAVAGSSLARSLSAKEALDLEKLKEETKMGYYGSEYKDKLISDQKKAFQKDSANINYLRQTMGIGEASAKEILETTGGKCFDNGITSIEDIATIHKLTNGKDKMSFNQAVAARNYAKKRLPSDPDKMTSKSVKQYKERWANEYREAGYANAEELANKSFNLAIRFNKAQSSLTKS